MKMNRVDTIRKSQEADAPPHSMRVFVSAFSVCQSLPRVLLIVCASAFAFACGDGNGQNSNTIQSKVVSECGPEEGDDACFLVEDNPEDPLVGIEDATGWRENSESTTGSSRADIDVNAINAGMLLEDPNQGHYDDVADFYTRLSFLLGVTVGTGETNVQHGTISESGSSLKYVGDPENAEEFGGATSGNFVCDAMTNAAGEVWIGGELAGSDCPSVMELDYSVDWEGEYLTAGGSEITTTAQAVTIQSGNEQADLSAFKTNWWFYKSIGSEIDNYIRNGKTTRWVYDPIFGFWPRWRKRVVRASEMYLLNTYYSNNRYVPSPGDQLFSKGVGRTNTDSLTLREWWIGAGICIDEDGRSAPCEAVDTGPVNTVCAFGRAGHASGFTGTNSSCPNLL